MFDRHISPLVMDRLSPSRPDGSDFVLLMLTYSHCLAAKREDGIDPQAGMLTIWRQIADHIVAEINGWPSPENRQRVQGVVGFVDPRTFRKHYAVAV